MTHVNVNVWSIRLWINIAAFSLLGTLIGVNAGRDIQFAANCGKSIDYSTKTKLLLTDTTTGSRQCDVTIRARSGRNIVVYFLTVPQKRGPSCADITLFDYTETEKTYQGELGRYIVKWNSKKTLNVCNNRPSSTTYRSISSTLKIRLKTNVYKENHGFAIQVEEDVGSVFPQLYFCYSTITFSGSMYVASYPWRKVEGAKQCITRFQARNKKHISIRFKELYIDGTVAGHCSYNGLLLSDGKSPEGPYLGGGYLCGDHIPGDMVSTHSNITMQLNIDKKTSLYPRRYYLALLQETDGEEAVTLVPLNAVIGTALGLVTALVLVAVIICVVRRRYCAQPKGQPKEKDTVDSTDTESVDIQSDTATQKTSPISSQSRFSPNRTERLQSAERPLIEPTAPPVEDAFSYRAAPFGGYIMPCGHPAHYAGGFPEPPPYEESERRDASA